MKRCAACSISLATAFALSAASVQGSSIGITFGDGTQGPTSGSVGPGVAQPAETWNLVNVGGWPNNGNDGNNNFSGDTGEMSGGNKVGDGTALATNLTIRIIDPGQDSAWMDWGSWGGCKGSATNGGSPAAYGQQYVSWGTAGARYGGDPTITIDHIPYAAYDLYIAGTNLFHAGVGISDAGTVFTGQSNSTFQFTTPWGHPYGGYADTASWSYIQIVEVTTTTTEDTSTTVDTTSTTTTTAPALQIDAIQASGNYPVVQWPGRTSWFFTVEYTPSVLPLVSWSNLLDYANVEGTEGTMSAIDTNHAGPQGFYRVKMTQP